jgi:Flp pilus assembly protein TadG
MTPRRPASRKRRDRQSGVAAVEFALLLPILLTLTLGAIEWGFFFFVDQRVTNAAREGARAGTLLEAPPITPAATGKLIAENAAKNYLTQVGLKTDGVVADPNVVLDDGTRGIKVTIRLPYVPLTGFLTSVLPKTAVGIAVMRWN